MSRKFTFLVILSLFCLLAACHAVQVPSQPPIDAALSVPVTVTQRILSRPTACVDHFITHTLPFATGTRLHEINTYESNGAGLAVNDLDADGDLDLVFASIDRESAILWNEGHLNFRVEMLADRFTRGVAIVDVDGDGMLDLVTGSYNTDLRQQGIADPEKWG